jgi:hypothetical protein
MHGFMNLFLAAALVWHRVPPGDLPALLEDEDPAGFSFDDARGQWRSHLLRTDALRDARFHFAMSFGSCSFEEPMADLRALKLL